MSDEEDFPQLSAETFAALTEFYKEQEDREQELQIAGKRNEGSHFEENWVKF